MHFVKASLNEAALFNDEREGSFCSRFIFDPECLYKGYTVREFIGCVWVGELFAVFMNGRYVNKH